MIRIIFLLSFFLSLSVQAQDYSKPDLFSDKDEFMTEMHDLINDVAKMDFTAATNIPEDSIRYNRTNDYFEEYDGASWAQAPIAIGSIIGTGTITGTMILDSTITSADIGAGEVASTDIADSTIVSGDIADSTIVSADIAANTITSSDIATNTVDGSNILDGSIATADILDGTITSTDIANSTIASVDIVDGTIQTEDVLNGTLVGSDIAGDTITHDNIGVGAVRSSEILDATITGSDLADSSVNGGTKVTTGWVDASITSGTLSAAASSVDGTGETGTYRYMRIGTTIYFYLALTYTASGTGDTLTLALPSTAANTTYSFSCMVSDADTVIAYADSTTHAILKRTSGNYGTGAGRTMKCHGFFEG